MHEDKYTSQLTSNAPPDLDAHLENAARKGALKALKEIGLVDEEAANDIRRLRDLATTIKIAQRTFVQTVVRWVTIALLILLFAGVAAKIGLFNIK